MTTLLLDSGSEVEVAHDFDQVDNIIASVGPYGKYAIFETTGMNVAKIKVEHIIGYSGPSATKIAEMRKQNKK